MGKLTAKQLKAVEKLLEGHSITAAAREGGIARKTLQRWLQLADFQAELRAGSDEAIGLAAIRLSALVDGSLSAMAEIRDSPTTTEGIRLRAADALLGHALKLREQAEILARIAALESKK